VYSGIVFLRTLYIQYSFLHTSDRPKSGEEGGGVCTVNMTHLAVPAGFHTCQLVLHLIYRISDKCGFSYN
jgi:hypothetical protein